MHRGGRRCRPVNRFFHTASRMSVSLFHVSLLPARLFPHIAFVTPPVLLHCLSRGIIKPLQPRHHQRRVHRIEFRGICRGLFAHSIDRNLTCPDVPCLPCVISVTVRPHTHVRLGKCLHDAHTQKRTPGDCHLRKPRALIYVHRSRSCPYLHIISLFS